MSVEPYTVIDADGHELVVLGANYVVIIDIGNGTHMDFAEFAAYDLAASLVECLRREDVDADIEIEHCDVIDVTATVPEWGSPLDHLAVDDHTVDDPSGWRS